MDKWISLGLVLGAFCGVLGAASILERPTAPRYFLFALTLVAVDLCLVSFAPAPSFTITKDLRWNWIGKAESILLSLAVFVAWPALRLPSGLTFLQANGSLKWSIILPTATAALLAFFIWQEPPEPFRVETLLYQLVMPTLAEELMYRGLLLSILSRAWPNTTTLARLPISWPPLACTMLFGFSHGISWHAGFNLDVVSLLYSTAIGSILMFLRLRSGSLVSPMATHSLLNAVATGLPMLH